MNPPVLLPPACIEASTLRSSILFINSEHINLRTNQVHGNKSTVYHNTDLRDSDGIPQERRPRWAGYIIHALPAVRIIIVFSLENKCEDGEPHNSSDAEHRDGNERSHNEKSTAEWPRHAAAGGPKPLSPKPRCTPYIQIWLKRIRCYNIGRMFAQCPPRGFPRATASGAGQSGPGWCPGLKFHWVAHLNRQNKARLAPLP
jgi:hypothetical protein